MNEELKKMTSETSSNDIIKDANNKSEQELNSVLKDRIEHDSLLLDQFKIRSRFEEIAEKGTVISRPKAGFGKYLSKLFNMNSTTQPFVKAVVVEKQPESTSFSFVGDNDSSMSLEFNHTHSELENRTVGFHNEVRIVVQNDALYLAKPCSDHQKMSRDGYELIPIRENEVDAAILEGIKNPLLIRTVSPFFDPTIKTERVIY